ncbi:uncharacterized protein VTP21DRAFT_8926 [Calcarisporiella thermophila]|uniref:uncharacterized protein n=1 Tax=Calcarisporiella thermophila TaxID=911321 RepID=UPI0037435B0B
MNPIDAVVQLPLEERSQYTAALRYFLSTAPGACSATAPYQTFKLPTGDKITCVFHNDIPFVSAPDILRILYCRFALLGRQVIDLRKFEEGIQSDLRHLQVGLSATLEETRSPLLQLLHCKGSIKTLKRQKVYFWFAVPYDRLFLDALERDIRRERRGMATTSIALAEPATRVSMDRTDARFFELRKELLGDEGASHLAGVAEGESFLEQLEEAKSATAFSLSPTSTVTHEDERENPALSFKDTLPDLSPTTSDYNPAVCSFDKRASSLMFSPMDYFSPLIPSLPILQPESPEKLSEPPLPTHDRPHVCPHEGCRKAFKRLQHYKRHQRTHTNLRPFVCETCGRAFARSDSLTVHQRTHQRNSLQPKQGHLVNAHGNKQPMAGATEQESFGNVQLINY